MAIVFPRELPEVGFVTADVMLADPVKASPSGARLINYTQVEDAAWQASMVTRPLLYSEYSAVEAWWLSLREGLRAVLFRHPWDCYPRLHRANHAPADVAGVLVSITNGNVLDVSGVDPALALSIGDRIGLERLGRYHIGRVADVSGAGTARQITIEPPPQGVVTQAGAVVRFARPALIMRPVPGSFQAPKASHRYNVSFQLRESQ
ncbi:MULTISPECIES: hypothetical protein [unclassified Ensifer]|uniref:hypothetical protein n=1 Tax=unclassified Ensifer TaxID=2633371 RepID=UPI000713DC41|nr:MULTISPECIES: hypothetical protein [unclassified Ensifer]KQX55459.1 hypothetical protein ASD49_25220 [Ensifer sp. Root1298]KQX90951.1 hypothetical protein ASD41_23910 [Ensifer sp. Root1312]KRC25795.1 hypothetical protein ASE29_22370 [Ensifer sp. Root74]KRD73675.1 hypothetical protein ASE71_19695 [Ensifer sp. Root954]